MGYLADKLHELTGVRITAEQEQTMEATVAVMGNSIAGFLHILSQAMQPRGNYPEFSNERVQAWIETMRPKMKPKINYELVKCPICGRELGANWLVRHKKQAHGRVR
jgi:hypothetical protein